MSNDAKPIPEGWSGVTPMLGVRDADAAIAFYVGAFGGVDRGRLTGPDGTIDHAEIEIGGGRVMLAEENPEWGNHAPPSLGGTAVRLHLYVEDVDAVFRRAVDAGAKALVPPDDQFYGDRSGRLEDPFGHVWVLATRVDELPMEEIQRRWEEIAGG